MDDIKTILFKVFFLGSNHNKRVNLIRRAKISLPINLMQIIPFFYKNYINATYSQIHDALRIIYKTIPHYIYYSIVNKIRFKINFSKSNSYCVENKKTAVVYIGDSHAEFWSRIHKKNINESIYCFHIGPVLANTFGSNSEKRQTIVGFLKRFQSLHNFDQLIIVLVFGEIDIRVHSYAQIHLYRRYTDETVYANDIAKKYVKAAKHLKSELIFEFKEKVNIELVIKRPVPPINNRPVIPKSLGEFKKLLDDNQFPNVGSIEKRIIADKKLSEQLFEQCKNKKILYQKLSKEIFTEDGQLNPDLSKDMVHITNMKTVLKAHLELMGLLANTLQKK